MAGRIFAVAGLSGAGKSTAVSYMAGFCSGEIIYFGDTVLKAVRESGLPEGSASEQKVRIDLRSRLGPAYLAMREGEWISKLLRNGKDVLVDAVYVAEEFEYLAGLKPEHACILIGIEAPFSVRRDRLEVRPNRPFVEREVRERDAVELKKLNTGNVLEMVHFRIRNEGKIEDLYSAIREVLTKC